jgi:hypothetical protein
VSFVHIETGGLGIDYQPAGREQGAEDTVEILGCDEHYPRSQNRE